MAGINTNYSQFYKGTEQVKTYGFGSGQKTSVARYEFNTTDDKGNKIMDKMSKEETYRTMNEISSQYGDDVIVEFSGDGLAAFDAHKMAVKYPEEHIPVPEEMKTYLEEPKAMTDEEISEATRKNIGDDMEAIMKHLDPGAYEEYRSAQKAGLSKSWEDGMIAGFRYMYQWITDNAAKDPNWLERKRGTLDALSDLETKYRNADIFIGDGSKMYSGDKEYSVILSDEELAILKNGTDKEKEKLFKLIDDSMRELSELRDKMKAAGAKDYKLGISIDKDNIVSFLANRDNKFFTATSTEEMLKHITKK